MSDEELEAIVAQAIYEAQPYYDLGDITGKPGDSRPIPWAKAWEAEAGFIEDMHVRARAAIRAYRAATVNATAPRTRGSDSTKQSVAQVSFETLNVLRNMYDNRRGRGSVAIRQERRALLDAIRLLAPNGEAEPVTRAQTPAKQSGIAP